MNREEVKNNLVSFKELQERWGYKSLRGVRKRAKFDKKFPQPIKVTCNGFKLFWLPEIEEYEKLRDVILKNRKRYNFYQTKQEWDSLSLEEKEKQRGSKYQEEGQE